MIPSLCFVLFLSREVLAPILSAINWIGLARIFGESRAAACVVLWLSSHIVVSVDANYRTYPSAVRSTILLGPLLIMVVACCAYRLIPDSNSPKVSIGVLTLESRQTVICTASTLVIFMVKKAYLRVYRQRVQARNEVDLESSGDRHVISCVVLHARMRLVPVISKQRLRLGTFVRNQAATAACTQQLRLAHHGSIILYVRRILLSEKQLELFVSPRIQFFMHLIAVIVVVSTATTWILMFYDAKEYTLHVGIVAAACSMICVVSSAVIAQRDLLRLLVSNFDVIFFSRSSLGVGSVSA